jgi:hypothetical protein
MRLAGVPGRSDSCVRAIRRGNQIREEGVEGSRKRKRVERRTE